MDFHGNINLKYNEMKQMVIPTESNFPVVAVVGRIVFKDSKLYMCVNIVNGIPAWIPLTNKISTYIHTQTIASTSWVIEHNLNTTIPIVQIYDDTGEMIIPDIVSPIDNNTMNLVFGNTIIGTAVVLYGAISLDVQNLIANSFNGWRIFLDTISGGAGSAGLHELSFITNSVNVSDVNTSGTVFASSESALNSSDLVFDGIIPAAGISGWNSISITNEYIGKLLDSAIDPDIVSVTTENALTAPIDFRIQKSSTSTNGIDGTWADELTAVNNNPWYTNETRHFPLVPVTDKLSAVDKASFVTLPEFNGGLYAFWSTGATPGYTYSTTIHNAGKWYFEYVAGSPASGPSNGIGIFNSGSLSTGPTNPYSLALNDTTTLVDGAASFTSVSWNALEVMTVSVDLDGGSITWTNLTTLTSSTKPINDVLISQFKIGLWARHTSSMSINFGATPFSGTIPSGYSSWDGNQSG